VPLTSTYVKSEHLFVTKAIDQKYATSPQVAPAQMQPTCDITAGATSTYAPKIVTPAPQNQSTHICDVWCVYCWVLYDPPLCFYCDPEKFCSIFWFGLVG
jgi:hypothetical protein